MWCGAARAASYQLAWRMGTLSGASLQEVEHRVHGSRREGGDRLGDGCQRRVEQVKPWGVVEADERDVLRYAYLCGAQTLQGAHRHQAVRGEHRRRRLPS